MFESEYATVDEGLAELVAEVGSAVGGLDEDFLGGLVQPLARLCVVFPAAVLFGTWIRGHIDGRTCQWQAGLTTCQTVANLSASACGSAIERLHGSGEVMCLSLQRDDGVDAFDLEVTGLILPERGELFHTGTQYKGHVVLVSRHQSVRVGGGSLLDEGEQGTAHLLAVDDEGAVEDLVAAVFRIHLGEAVHLAISKLAANLFLDALEIGYLLVAQRQAFLNVIGGNIVDMLQRFRFAIHREDLLVEVVVHRLKHRIKRSVFRIHLEEFFDTDNAFNAHVLGDFDGIGTPGGDHLPTGTNKKAFHRLGFDHGGLAKKP